MESKPTVYKEIDYKNFDRIKLIIGNGFDLACGLHSSYGDFFHHSAPLYEEIKNWIDENSVFPEEATAWDLYFYLLSEHDDIKDPDRVDWKDIETRIYEAVRPNGKFPFTFDSLGKHTNKEQELLNRFFVEKISDVSDKHKSFRFLYEELIRFEKRFADFLLPQQEDEIYNKNVEKMLMTEGLLKFKNPVCIPGKKPPKCLVSIDTFNYTTPKYFDKLKSVNINHVNGKIGYAIFGIDRDGIPNDDEAFIFTKIYRKINNIANGNQGEFIRGYHNIVIFGHSFSKADYSYYRPILNSLEVNKTNSYEKNIVIAFSNYAKEESANSELLNILYDSFTKMVNDYNNNSDPDTENEVTLEMLERTGRLRFYAIDNSLLLKANQ